jgi:hypothetical protein
MWGGGAGGCDVSGKLLILRWDDNKSDVYQNI